MSDTALDQVTAGFRALMDRAAVELEPTDYAALLDRIKALIDEIYYPMRSDACPDCGAPHVRVCHHWCARYAEDPGPADDAFSVIPQRAARDE